MSRLSYLAVAAAVATTIATPALAEDQTQWSFGIGSIGISFATPTINLSVKNLSNSPYADDRKLTNVSAPPAFKLDGQVFCKAILSGSTRLVKSQLMFGNPIIQNGNQGAMLWPIGVWDSSAPILYQGNSTAANVHIDHAMDLPATWNGGLVTLGFNPVKVVEDRLASYVSNGGSAVQFLRTDDVFEVQVSANLIGQCENTSSYGVHNYSGYTRRTITVAIFYKGDTRIQYEPVAGGPGSVKQPTLPSSFYVQAPPGGEPSDGSDVRNVAFARFPIFDIRSINYRGNWSGWATSSSDLCSSRPLTAVTPDGRCAYVDGCVPVEFDSCRALQGCCDAPLRTTAPAPTR